MRIVIHSEEELIELARKLLHISVNMRHWQKEWHQHHGAVLLGKKKDWEGRMDALLEELKAERSKVISEVKLIVKDE
jgi:hypothetical protein